MSGGKRSPSMFPCSCSEEGEVEKERVGVGERGRVSKRESTHLLSCRERERRWDTERERDEKSGARRQ